MEGVIKNLKSYNKLIIPVFFLLSVLFLFLPKITLAAPCTGYTGYYDEATKDKIYVDRLSNAENKRVATLTKQLNEDNFFVGKEEGKNNFALVITDRDVKATDGTATKNWAGTMVITPEGQSSKPSCDFTMTPGGKNSGGVVAADINGGSQNGGCNGPFEKSGQWLLEGLAKSMTGYFSLINRELNWTSDLEDQRLKDVWKSVRNLSLGLITLALIIIAFANLLNIDINQYGVNKMIPKLLIAIVMSYFSFFIARIMLEMASGLQALVLTTMAKNADLTKLDVGAGLDASCGGSVSVMGLLLGIVVMVIAFCCFLYLLLVLIVRKVVIFFLVAVAPLAFMMNVLPFTAKLYTDWWKRFSSWVFMGPAIMFVLYLGVTFMSIGGGDSKEGDVLIQILMAGVSVAIAAMVPTMMGGEIYKGIKSAAGTFGKYSNYVPGVKTGKKAFEMAKTRREGYANTLRTRSANELLDKVSDRGGAVGGVLTGKRGVFSQDFAAGKSAYMESFKDAELSTLQARLGAKTAGINLEDPQEDDKARINDLMQDPEAVAIMETMTKNHHAVTFGKSNPAIMAAKLAWEGGDENTKARLSGVNSGIATNADKDAPTTMLSHALENNYFRQLGSVFGDEARKKLEKASLTKIGAKSVSTHSKNDSYVVSQLSKTSAQVAETNKEAQKIAADIRGAVGSPEYNSKASTTTKEAHAKDFPETSINNQPEYHI